MRKHAETFRNCRFYTHLQEDEGLQTPNFYLKFNQFNIVFLMTRDKWQCF